MRRQSWVTDFNLVRLQRIENKMDTGLRELSEVLRSITNYLEFFKHFLSIYFSVTARHWACKDEDGIRSLLKQGKLCQRNMFSYRLNYVKLLLFDRFDLPKIW